MGVIKLNYLRMRKWRTARAILGTLVEYARDTTKTDGGRLVTAYGCDPDFAVSQFLLTMREYRDITGREFAKETIAYEVVQSFRPGEISPEEANRVGLEFASRFTRGEHAFMVCTHTDKEHIHNHIVWNAVALSCIAKYAFDAVPLKGARKLSDQICEEHGLSVETSPRRFSLWYSEWKGEMKGPSMRTQLKEAIDRALEKRPADLEALISMLREEGYEARTGSQTAFRPAGQKKFINLSSLKKGYSEQDIISVLKGEKEHIPFKRKVYDKDMFRDDLVSRLEDKLRSLKDDTADSATEHLRKKLSDTIVFLRGGGYSSMEDMSKALTDMNEKISSARGKIRAAETEISDLRYLRDHLNNYLRTESVWNDYRRSGYSERFRERHEGDIILHRASGNAMKKLGLKKLPSPRELNSELDRLLSAKEAAYAEYRSMMHEQKELAARITDVENSLCSPDLPGRKTELPQKHADGKTEIMRESR